MVLLMTMAHIVASNRFAGPVLSTYIAALQTDLGSTPAAHQRQQGFWAALWVYQGLMTGPLERLDSLHARTVLFQQLHNPLPLTPTPTRDVQPPDASYFH